MSVSVSVWPADLTRVYASRQVSLRRAIANGHVLQETGPGGDQLYRLPQESLAVAALLQPPEHRPSRAKPRYPPTTPVSGPAAAAAAAAAAGAGAATPAPAAATPAAGTATPKKRRAEQLEAPATPPKQVRAGGGGRNECKEEVEGDENEDCWGEGRRGSTRETG